MLRHLPGLLLRVLLLACLASVSATAQPSLTFDTNASTGSGTVLLEDATPEGEVIWFSVERAPTGYFVSVDIRRESTLADAEGTVSVRFEEEVPTRSVWAVIDLTSGEFALASPSSYGLLEQPFKPDAFSADAEGLADQVRHEHRVVEVLWVRPGIRSEGAGAWQVRAADGGQHDEDGILDGSVSVQPASLFPVADEAETPAFFAPGDVVVLIDPATLEISATRLEEGRGGASTGEAGGAR